MLRDIGLLAFPGFQIIDLTGPAAVFEGPADPALPRAYRLHPLSEHGGMVRSSSGLEILTQPLERTAFDTLLAVGGPGTLTAMESPAIREFLKAAAADSRRIASVCTGAFLLAAAGLLDGRHATTHWKQAALLQRLFPRVRVDEERIFIQDGAVWTSAGASAGIDLSLALLEEDLGREASRAAARELVVYHRRPGGQSQFSTLLELEPPSDRIRLALAFAREHLHEPLPVERLAQAACLSPRQFGREFLAETGQTPAKAVERLRAEAARLRIETSTESIEAIARETGFSDPERMRRACIRVFGHPPQALRRTARATG
ncbi:Transcriptional regulator GlxA family, contains an amidase domain and an AraC-type DNA-binding HTH domain [Stigmatella aurantiaca]|uniref:Transcriptional regulator GlxA family, contains an amidase domain and an AraC-type DNA-binding HTH domain n=1 Tax=Stigmatella aurantiaca TaxID=41 RepID=A0A1H7S1U8_STIAU|nr:helix-turn-helix domain-containing protein [Stigmatella aurantiaca]SEL66435.1 Transcriptional regulator GlxA family, contains an amidase domain and an AraC-type DNA-binding HTH domain [Stigmatella aurantiaca]